MSDVACELAVTDWADPEIILEHGGLIFVLCPNILECKVKQTRLAFMLSIGYRCMHNN